MSLLARPGLAWRPALLAALCSLALAGVASLALTAGRVSLPGTVRPGSSAANELSTLPLSAQGPISAALGSESPAYRVSARNGSFRAFSPAQRLTSRFERSGVQLSSGTLRLTLSPGAVGYGSSRSALGVLTPSVNANRVTYTHAGLSEWFLNGPAGLEQGFTIGRAPSVRPAGPLTLSMALAGDAHASLSAGGDSIIFSHAGASSLRYGGLTATDATGRILHSSLALAGGRILLHVDTAGARYPLRLDPLIQQGEELTGAGEEGRGQFGLSVALSADGDTALIGAPYDEDFAGAVWVFTRSGSNWIQQGPKLTGEEPGAEGGEEGCAEETGEEPAGCGFGESVALSADGDTALIGGLRDNAYQGAVWVFTRSGSTWTQQGEKLTGGEERGPGHFGRSVALSADGDTALIGGGADRDARGAAWVFTRSGSTWTQQGPKLTGSEGSGERRFGGSVALSSDGNTALIGGPADTGHLGAAWVFTRSGSEWTQQGSKLTGGKESGEGRFGYSVALSSDGNTALIGGRSDGEAAGAAWVFTRSGTEWTQQASKLTGSEESDAGEFGYSVALSGDGDTALIGGPRDDKSVGTAWVFTRSGSEWTQQAEQLTGAEESAKSWFGASVALSADANTALIGAAHDDGRAGAAWAFANLPAPTLTPTVTKVAPASGPAGGATTVSITGTNFTAATAVNFGPASAVSFTVRSASSITAVSPAETPGTADVSVTTPAGRSAISAPNDHFKFLAPTAAKSNLTPTETPAGPNGEPTTATATGGVLGFRATPPTATATCKASLASRSITVQRHSRAALKLTGTGSGKCAGRLTLTVKRRTHSKRSKTTTIATASFSISPGKTRIVEIKLNGAGRALLRAGHGRLNASLAILRLSPAPVKAQTASVHLKL